MKGHWEKCTITTIKILKIWLNLIILFLFTIEIFDYYQLNCIKLSITYETKSYQLRIPFTKRLWIRTKIHNYWWFKVLRYLAPKIWNIVPIDIRNYNSLSEFTTKIKSCKPVTSPCNLCRTFIDQVGYID